jgi:hypothetical protein
MHAGSSNAACVPEYLIKVHLSPMMERYGVPGTGLRAILKILHLRIKSPIHSANTELPICARHSFKRLILKWEFFFKLLLSNIKCCEEN